MWTKAAAKLRLGKFARRDAHDRSMRRYTKCYLSFSLLLFSLVVMPVSMPAHASDPTTYPLTYSGRLVDALGAPLTGALPLQFYFYNAAQDGTRLGAQTPYGPSEPVMLNEGVFSVRLDLTAADISAIFGDTNTAVWIEVRNGNTTYPRQRFTYVPLAFFAQTVPVDGQTIAFDSNGKLKVLSGANGAGSGDMLKSVYDSNTDGIVDNAAQLNGQQASYYLNAANLTGTLDPARLPIGTTAGTVAAGDDARFLDARTPSGSAGGDLSGSYPNPTLKSSPSDDTQRAVSTDHIKNSAVTTAKLADGTVTDAKLAGAIAPAKIATDASNRFVSDTDKTSWNSAVSWGNHANAGYLTSVPWATPGVIGATTPAAASFTDVTANFLKATSALKLKDNDGTDNYVTLKAADAMSSDVAYTLPAAPIAGQYLTTDSNGNLSWNTPSGIGGGDMMQVVYDADGNGTVNNAENAAKLGNQVASYYLNASNLASGTVAYARLPVGTTASTVAAGDDARFSDARTPSGTAGGDLSGSFPNPTLKSSATVDADRAVTSDHIKDSAISSTKLAANAVTSDKIADDAITSTKIANTTIIDADIAGNAAIADTKLATISTAGKVSGAAITTGTIAGNAAFNGSGGINTSGSITTSGTVTATGAITGTGNIIVNATGTAATDLRFNDNDNSNYVALKAPSAVATNVTWTLPSTDGANGQILQTNGSGALSWVSGSAAIGAAGGALTGAYPSPSLANNSVASSNITDGAIATADIADSAVTSAKIADATIADADIASNAAIADSKLATISTAGKVSGAAITTGTIAGNTTLNTSGNIVTTGSIGIGATSPSTALDIESALASSGLDINNTAADGDPRIAFQLSGTSTFTMGIDDSDSDKFKIGTTTIDTNTRLTIDGSGKVGVGTSTPTVMLDVNGTLRAKNIVKESFTVTPAGTYDGSSRTWVRLQFSAMNAGATPPRIKITRNINSNAGTPYGGPVLDVSLYAGSEFHFNTGGWQLNYSEHGSAPSQYISQVAFLDEAGARFGVYFNMLRGIEYMVEITEGSATYESINDNSAAPASNAAIGYGSNFGRGATTTQTIGSGGVGIGTTSPASLLSVGSSSQFSVDSSGNLTKINNVAYSWPAAQGGASTVLTNNGSGTLSWSTVSSSQWTTSGSNIYYNTGNVGIGTTSPTASLDVRGSTSIRGSNTNSPATPVAALELFTGRDAAGGLLTGQTSADVAFQWGGAGGGYRHWIRTRHFNGTGTGNALDFYVNSSLTAGGSSAPGTGNTHTMTLEGGNVGIGTTSPASLLSVGASSQFTVNSSGNITKINNVAYSWPAAQGGASTVLTNNGSGTLSWSTVNSSQWTTSGSDIYYNTGNVGIGTTGPTVKFVVAADGAGTWGNEQFRIQGATNSNDRFAIGFNTSGADSTHFAWMQGGNPSSYANLSLNPVGGNVGIGTTSPAGLLSVGSSSQFNVDSSGNLTKVNNVTYSWPASQGSSSTVLTNDGSGNLSWAASANLTLVSRQQFSSSGTWTKPSGVKRVRVLVIGGGGGGGGGNNGGVVGGGGGGGGSGAICYKDIDVTSIASATITIGAAGSGAAINTNGGNGGDSSFGNLIIAKGGSGGGSTGAGGAGGVTGGDASCLAGTQGTARPGSVNPGGAGASAVAMGIAYGVGGSGGVNGSQSGSAGSFYGSGGGGGGGSTGGQAQSSGAGGPGYVAVMEFQ